jgi:hypothetical protein
MGYSTCIRKVSKVLNMSSIFIKIFTLVEIVDLVSRLSTNRAHRMYITTEYKKNYRNSKVVELMTQYTGLHCSIDLKDNLKVADSKFKY